MSAPHTKYITLNRTGDKIPLVGFGTARIPNEDTENVVYTAIKNGYRLIDGALLYRNEAEVGQGVRKAIAEGIVKREEITVVGKLWNHYHGKEHVRPIFEETLKNYGLDYIDLYLVHFPFATEYEPFEIASGIFNKNGEFKLARAPLHETWAELEKLVDEGLIRNIGICNANTQLLTDLLSYARIKPAVLEIELHPYFQQKRLVKWVKQQEIQVIAYASFGNVVFDAVPPHLAHLEKLLSHPVIKKLAEKHKINAGQVALGWAVQNEYVVIPKSVNEDRMRANLAAFDVKFDKEDLKELDALEAKARFNDFYVENYTFDYPLFD